MASVAENEGGVFALAQRRRGKRSEKVGLTSEMTNVWFSHDIYHSKFIV